MCDCEDQCQGTGVSRRAFLERSSAVALGALLAGCQWRLDPTDHRANR